MRPRRRIDLVVGFAALTLNQSLRHGGPVGRLDELVVDRNHSCQGIAFSKELSDGARFTIDAP